MSANFIGQQGPKAVKVSYWANGAWEEVEASVENSVAPENDQRRQMLALNIPHIVSPKIKLDLEFNTDWNKGVIIEANAIGTKIPSAAAVAELVQIDPLTAGSTKLTFSNLDKAVKNWEQNFTISVAKTSNPEAVRADGTVNHTGEDQTSQVTLSVQSKAGDTATTGAFEVTVPRALEENKTQADIQIDSTTAYKNPAMGWVAYVEGFECAVHDRFEYPDKSKSNNDFSVGNWNARNKGMCVQIGTDAESARAYTAKMDELIAQGMPCNVVYIREPWSWFEPTEGNYAWNDPNSACHVIVNWARQNNIQLAFRIITCTSACAQQATPEWVFTGTNGEKGAAVASTQNYDYVKGAKEPYLDDPVFVEKFGNFVEALGKEFNNEGTAFIDAHGHGEWGEMNNKIWTTGNRKAAIQALENCFIEAFPDVLLGGQQGSSQGGGAIEESFKTDGNNFVVRRDAFGSKRYLYDSGNANAIKKYRFQDGIPVFAENCYHHFDSRNFRWSKNIAYSSGSNTEYGGDNPFNTMQDMMGKVIDHALDLGANTIDLRTLEDAQLWMANGQEFLDEFTQEGGYRISVDDAIFTNQVKQGGELTVESSWVNNGAGIVPNNNKHWDKKMQVAFALIDQDGNIVQREIVSPKDINVGNFEKKTEEDYTYETSFQVDEGLSGTYKLAVGIVNKKADNNIGIQLANKGEITNGGYLTLGTVNVSESGLPVNTPPTINANDQTLTVGDVFDPLANVTATDTEDGDLTAKIVVVKNEVDTSKAGTYEVTYKVTDKEGASTTKTIYVTVNPKTEVINHIPTIEAEDKELKVGDKFDPLAGVTAKDKEDGDLTSKIEIVNNTVDTSKAGTYEVTYKVTDSQKAAVTKTIQVTVKQTTEVVNHAPTIHAANKTITAGETFDPMANVTATDTEDGDLTNKIEVVENTVDVNTAGIYAVTYQVTDSQGASATKTIYVTVNPKTEVVNQAPTIHAANKTITAGDEFLPMQGVTATDAEDGDLTAAVEVLRNTVDIATPGIYEVTYKVTDSQGASATKTIYVTVNPRVEVVNHVPTIHAGNKTITAGETFIPMDGVFATDVEDGDLTAAIEVVNNTVDTDHAGIYEVTYKVTDSQGASATKTIYVTVNPKMEEVNHAPAIDAEDRTITVGDAFNPLEGVTATDKEDKDLTAAIEVVNNTVDATTPGIYEVTYKVTDSQGASVTKTIYVTVNPKTEVVNQAPTIDAKDQTIKVGDAFDPLKDVTAADAEDGDLTAAIEVLNNTVDTENAGTYEVTYKVTDSQGASATKTITVTVKEKDTDKPVTPDKPGKPGDTQKPGQSGNTQKPGKGDAPVTGDTAKVGLLASLVAASGALAGVVLFRRRKKK